MCHHDGGWALLILEDYSHRQSGRSGQLEDHSMV